jgi:3-hydroxyisobutyrate dehydrogenase-like beta-hydroxyacid dehydrogenase
MGEGVMAKLGFLGLGIMGGPMAKRLLAAGHEVALWSYSKGKAEALGGTPCATPREVAALSDCVFLCVGDTAMSREVIFGEHGLAAGAKKGLVIADCSTISPTQSRAMATELAALGVEFLDAPCTGSKGGAENGTLTFMVGGKKDVFELMRPWFEPMGKQFYYCGESGQGLHAKLSQNMILGNLLQAFNESIVLSTKAGVPPELMLEIIENSAAKSGLAFIEGPAGLQARLRSALLGQVAGEGYATDAGLRRGTECSCPADLALAADVSGRDREGLWGGRHLRFDPLARRPRWLRGQQPCDLTLLFLTDSPLFFFEVRSPTNRICHEPFSCPTSNTAGRRIYAPGDTISPEVPSIRLNEMIAVDCAD